MKLKYVGPARDYSGYGEATRHDVAALIKAGINVTLEAPRYCMEISDYGKVGYLCAQAENKKLGYEIKILHVTPNVYPKYFEQGKYHIGRVFWETNKLPLQFALNVEKLDEIWTGSEYNAQAIRNAGVTKPIYIIPEAIDADVKPLEPYIIPNTDDFKFYSIFEWTERKNPRALLTAFWQEFEKEKNVSLTIKTYVDNFTPEKRDMIKSFIRKSKKLIALDNYAPVYIYRNLLDRFQMYRFHNTFDCFVSAHRGEGWGIPQMEALILGKPVISTNCGGIHEHLVDSKDALLVPYKHVQVQNSRNEYWYTTDQKWAEIDIDQLRKRMRWVYENQKEAKKMAKHGQKTVVQKFSLETVGQLMLNRLREIHKNEKAA